MKKIINKIFMYLWGATPFKMNPPLQPGTTHEIPRHGDSFEAIVNLQKEHGRLSKEQIQNIQKQNNESNN